MNSMTSVSSPQQMPAPTLDRDYDYYGGTEVANGTTSGTSPTTSSTSRPRVKKGLGAMPMQAIEDPRPPPPAQRPLQQSTKPPARLEQEHPEPQEDYDHQGGAEEQQQETMEGDEALLDLEQLEELHHEAERMKALGNKHMAAQEYTRAYNAYSAALQLSPVGPSSHVFLSNRSAALLSLKRYSAAATDARRAIALAPTFGKAHARLGQSLYFLKDYEGAVAAYEDAIHYEPDNPITKTYLEKARTKWQRQKDKVMKNTGRGGGEELSVLTAESSVQHTVVNSVATDPNAAAAVVTTGFRGQSKAMMDAVGRDMTRSSATKTATTNSLPTALEGGETAVVSDGGAEDEEVDEFDYNQDDPDFDEALRIQERANRYLANKNYKYAIEEYTAALFLVPDDENLSPELHLGRAHALNGSRRHESAKIDAKLAIRIKPTPEAYSTLAKSLFYMKDYEGAIEAFGQCKGFLPQGESLSMFDRAYLQKAETALQEELEYGNIPSSQASKSNTPIPKLKPPKFVSREEALHRTPNMPAMPKEWPAQSPRDKKAIKFGPEREVLFLSEALGIKLNRGPDGIVRVIEVSPDVPGSPIAREGNIEVGDVIREAAGVDIRRPITNIMWGDTVALVKMAPRPIVLVVAKEQTSSIMDQRMQAAQNALSPTSASHFFPSNSNTEESVKEMMDKNAQQQCTQSVYTAEGAQIISDIDQQSEDILTSVGVDVQKDVKKDGVQSNIVKEIEEKNTEVKQNVANVREEKCEELRSDGPQIEKSLLDDESEEEIAGEELEVTDEDGSIPEQQAEKAESSTMSAIATALPKVSNLLDRSFVAPEPTPAVDLREEEEKMVGGEIMFLRNLHRNYSGWDNLRWMAFSGVRKVQACEPVYRFVEGRKAFLWNKEEYVPRKLAVYENPNLILILRHAENLAEFRELMELPSKAEVDEGRAINSHLFVESVVDPKTAKLRLSPLTTVTSIIPDVPKEDFRRRSCFELINPFESIVLSAVRLRKGGSFSDSGAFLETSGVEYAVTKSITRTHEPQAEDPQAPLNLSWRHQIILGTLHSFVVVGNQKYLDMAIHEALQSENGKDNRNPNYLNPRIVDAIDECGKTALHYACRSRFGSAVKSLVSAGADVNIRMEPDNMTPCHICAKNLDFSSLEVILALSRRPNVIDGRGCSPMYLAITEGRMVGGQPNPESLHRCISVLEKYGGGVEALMYHRHPLSFLASHWRVDELEVVLRHCPYRYPLRLVKGEEDGISIGALYQYPVHAALIFLRKRLQDLIHGCEPSVLAESETQCIKTLTVLFSCGFEPNERIEGIVGSFPEKDELASHIGFAPVQIVAAALLDVLRERDILGEVLLDGATKLLSNIMKYMVQNGSRLSLEAPPVARFGESRRPSSQSSISENAVTGSDDGSDQPLKTAKRSDMKIQANKELMKILESQGISETQKIGKAKPAPASSKSIFFTDKLGIENSRAPGGSDEKSCAICWKGFGMLVRKHRCRLSRRFICDECSTQRIIYNGDEHRVSDGQYLLAKFEANKKLDLASEKGIQSSRPQQYIGTEARLEQLEAEENAKRDSLFGGIVSSVTNALAVTAEGEDANQQSESDLISGLSSQLNQTRDALNERGAKLSTLADKSDKLVSASADFAAMAKELNRKSSQGFFSW